MRGSRLVRALVGIAAVTAAFCFTYRLADGLTVCQIGNGCLGTSTAPAYGNLLVGGRNGEYEFVATSTLGQTFSIAGLPLTYSAGVLGINQASATQSGYISAADWSLLHTATTTFSTPLSYSNSTNAVTCPTCNTSNASISSIIAGTGLTGGTITTNGTIALSTPVSIANGGTATTTQVANGLNYFDGTEITSGTGLSWSGTLFSISPTIPSANGSFVFNTGSSGSAPLNFSAPNSNQIAEIFIPAIAANYTLGIVNTGSGSMTTVFGNTTAKKGTGSNFVGINATSTPGGLLSIAGSAGGTVPLFVISSSTSAAATTTVLIIDQNGRIGIATTSPLASLDVEQGDVRIPAGRLNLSNSISGSNALEYLYSQPGTGQVYLGARNNLVFQADNDNNGTGNIDFTLGSNAQASTPSGIAAILLNNGNFAVGSTTPTAIFQATTASSNATTSIEFGKANQNKGTCLTLFDSAGSPVYIYIAAGATTLSLQNGGTMPSGCSD